jgi:hypothetical protein
MFFKNFQTLIHIKANQIGNALLCKHMQAITKFDMWQNGKYIILSKLKTFLLTFQKFF